MADSTPLPRSWMDWLRVFGPGAIIASLTIGTGELIFSTRGGALFGYHILFVFALISLMKWTLVISTSRHMILTGVHPYERMLDLPGPRGWLPIMLLLMSVVCMPIWISFHSGVLGNLTAWITDTRHMFHGGIDYLWGAGILAAVLLLSATGGYTVLEKTQTAVVLSMVFCAGLTLVLYQPDWLQLLLGLLPHPLKYPDWTPASIAKHSEWVETTRYMGVIGGAGFDYLSYTSWLREKSWGVLPERATPEQLQEIADDPQHRVRKWINAPLVDCTISFVMVVIFSAVFVASGAMFLGPQHVVPDENNLLNLQAKFVTQIHPWLLPLYVIGAFLTMLGTLYGTVEIACSIADEIVRSFVAEWTPDRVRRLRRAVIGWCASVAMLILAWLFVRQRNAISPSEALLESVPLEKPRLLLALLTPVNLFTGVLFCGLVCVLTAWMDRRWLPIGLRPPAYLTGFNLLGGILFLTLGLKGYWDNEHRSLAVGSMLGLFAAAVLIAQLAGTQPKSPDSIPSRIPGDSP